MFTIKELTTRSFFPRKPLRLTSPLLAAAVLRDLSLPTHSWPPSLVPTWKTTAWTGLRFVRLLGSTNGLIRRLEPVAAAAASVFPHAYSRETPVFAANARAPPRCLPEVQNTTEDACYQQFS